MRKAISKLKSSALISMLALAGCWGSSAPDEDSTVATTYTHQYGFPLKKEEFVDNKYPGQVTTTLKNGTTIIQTYEEGLLHGASTYTFPYSKTVQTYELYNEGKLVKQIRYDIKGMPLEEKLYTSSTVMRLTKWYADGVPMSIEQYVADALQEGQYFNQKNEIEAFVKDGIGERLIRTNEGRLIAKEQIQDGFPTKHEDFYENRSPLSIAYYKNGLLHGEKIIFTQTGEPSTVEEYVDGKLHGKVVKFENGAPAIETYYLNGLKNGVETHFIDGKTVVQKLTWFGDKKHGPCTYYAEDGSAQVQYYYDGALVTPNQWKELNRMDALINQIQPSSIN